MTKTKPKGWTTLSLRERLDRDQERKARQTFARDLKNAKRLNHDFALKFAAEQGVELPE